MPTAYDLPLRVNPMQVETPVETKTRLAQLADLSAQTDTRKAQTKNLDLQGQTIDLQNQQLQRTISGQKDVEDLIRLNMSGGGQGRPQPGAPAGGDNSSPSPNAGPATAATRDLTVDPKTGLRPGESADGLPLDEPRIPGSGFPFSSARAIMKYHGMKDGDIREITDPNRPQTPEFFARAADAMKRAGVGDWIPFIVPLPGNTPGDGRIPEPQSTLPGKQTGNGFGYAARALTPDVHSSISFGDPAAAGAGQLENLNQILPGSTQAATPAPMAQGQGAPPAPMPQTQGTPTAPMPQMQSAPQGQPAKVAGYSSVMPNWDGVIKGLYQRGRVPEAMALQKTILDNQKLIGDVEKLHLDNKKTQVETAGKSVEFVGRILASAHDQPSYNAALGVIAGMGMPTNDLPRVYDKAVVDQHVKDGLTVQQQLEAHTRELDDEIKRRKEARTATEFPAELAKKESDAIIAGQKAAGTEPIQPADQARIDAENARRVETDRHNQVTEKQGAGRLRVQEQRLAQTTGGVPLTPYQQSIADKLASGDFNPAQLTRFPDKEALIAGAIAKNPNWSPQTFATKKAFEDPQSKQSQNLGTISRIVGHIGRFEKNSNELGVSPSFFTGVNLSPLASATREDAHAISAELEKLVSGGVGTEGQVRSWQNSLSSSNPEIRKQAIDEVSQLIGSQYEGMNQTYKTTIGSDLPIEKYVSPAGREWMKAKGINARGAAPAGAGAAAPPTISDRASYDKLPSGSVYIDAGDGQQKRKK